MYLRAWLCINTMTMIAIETWPLWLRLLFSIGMQFGADDELIGAAYCRGTSRKKYKNGVNGVNGVNGGNEGNGGNGEGQRGEETEAA